MKSYIPYWYLLLGPSLAFVLGFVLNAIVMAANHGQMPVLIPGGCHVEDMDDLIHSCMTHASHLKFLADWIVVRHLGVASPGDFLEWFFDATYQAGLAAWAALMIRDKHLSYENSI